MTRDELHRRIQAATVMYRERPLCPLAILRELGRDEVPEDVADLSVEDHLGAMLSVNQVTGLQSPTYLPLGFFVDAWHLLCGAPDVFDRRAEINLFKVRSLDDLEHVHRVRGIPRCVELLTPEDPKREPRPLRRPQLLLIE